MSEWLNAAVVSLLVGAAGVMVLALRDSATRDTEPHHDRGRRRPLPNRRNPVRDFGPPSID